MKSIKHTVIVILIAILTISSLDAQSTFFLENSENLKKEKRLSKKSKSIYITDTADIKKVINNKSRYEDYPSVEFVIKHQIDNNQLEALLETFPNLKELSLASYSNFTKIEFTSKVNRQLQKIEILRLSNIEISEKSLKLKSSNLKGLYVKLKKPFRASEDDKNYSNEFDLAFFSNCKKVEEIILQIDEKYSIKNFQEIHVFKKLTAMELNLSGFGRGSQPFKDINKLNKLKLLSLLNASYCSLEGIEKQKKLEKLIAKCQSHSKQNLSTNLLSNNIYLLKNLKTLTLKNTTINSNIGQLTNLTDLTIKNYYGDLPKTFYALKKLKHLEIISYKSRIALSAFNSLKNLESIKVTADIRESNGTTKLELPVLRKLDLTPFPSLNYPTSHEQTFLKETFDLDRDYKIRQGEAFLILPNSLIGIENIEELIINARSLTTFNLDLKPLIKLKHLKFFTIEDDIDYEEIIENENSINRMYNFFEPVTSKLFAQLPHLQNLETLDLSYNVLKANDVQKVIHSISPAVHKTLSINLSNACLVSLPDLEWNDLQTNCIDLSNNFIRQIPLSLLQSNYESIKLTEQESDCGSHYAEEKLKYGLNQFIYGEIPVEKLEKKKATLDYILNEESIGLTPRYIEVAYAIDSVYLESKIDPIYLARYYFEKKDYKKTIALYERSTFLKNDENLVDHYLFVLSLYQENKLGKAKEVIEDIKSLEYATIKKRRKGNYSEDYALSNEWLRYIKILSISTTKESDELLSTFIKNKELEIEYDECNRKISFYLDLLEIYLVSNENDKYDNLLLEIEKKFDLDPRSRVIIDYLNIVKDLNEGNFSEANFITLTERLENYEDYLSWNPAIVDIWAILEHSENYEQINSLNKKVHNVSNYLIWR